MIASHQQTEIDSLRKQVQALSRANANAAQLMAELQEARELEELLTQRNRELILAQTLEADRSRVLEMVVRNEPMSVIVGALFDLIGHQVERPALALTVLRSGKFEAIFDCGIAEAMKTDLERMAFSVDWEGLPCGSAICEAMKSDLSAAASRFGMSISWCRKIEGASGRLLGALSVFTDSTRRAPDPKLLEKVVVTAGFVLEHFQLYEELAHQAQHDALTGLPNRILFDDRLRQAIALGTRNQRKLAVLWIDPDRFKLVNDTLGHRVGDELLHEVSARLKASVRASDTVARMGGDEFAVILNELDAESGPERYAQKIVDALQHPVRVGEHDLLVTGSIGVACFPEHGEDGTTLVRAADIAMYSAKASGKNGFKLFSSTHEKGFHTRLTLERNLRQAIRENEFHLKFEPQCKPDGTLVAVEALIRWTSPELGAVPPDEFIPIAESSGMIIPIGDWVLEEACRQAAAWADAGLPTKVAINVSPQQLLRHDFCGKVRDSLNRHGLTPGLLELELTETSIVSHPEECHSQLESLQRLGIAISIDDFGTGYSSLSRLQGLPIDAIKIDRQFVSAIKASNSREAIALVKAIIKMAESLRLDVVAEGVETSQQREILRGLGCERMQGYLFSRPISPAEVEGLIRQSGVEEPVEFLKLWL